MVKKKELATLDTPRRRSKRLMKLKADDPPESFHQQPNELSTSSTLLSPEIAHGNDDITVDSDNDDNLEDLAIDVFRNMKHMLVNSSGGVCKSMSLVEQQPGMLMLEGFKAPCKQTQL